jgi:ribose transport system permease protein
MSTETVTSGRKVGIARRIDLGVALVLAGCVALVFIGSLINPAFLTANYLLQQFQIAAFIGIIATGSMFVILLGEIDLSIPWTITSTAIVTTTLAGSDSALLQLLAVPVGILVGLLIGAINGVGVAVFRIPSMVWTLAINAMLLGATVFYTGGFKPRGVAPPVSIDLALGRTAGIPNALLTWLVVAALALWMLKRTVYGIYLYAMGNSQKALFLAGARVRRVTIATFALAGGLTSFGGLLLVGYANQAYQGMGDAYLLPAITTVVIGGTSIQGGKGNYIGTFAGALFITLLSSILSVLQMTEAARQVIFGAIILAMLLIHRTRSGN